MGTGERWSSTKCVRLQSDARATNLASAVRFVYQLNLPAGQSTAVDMLRRCHADAWDLHARPGRNGRPKILIFPSLAGCLLPAILSPTSLSGSRGPVNMSFSFGRQGIR